MFTGIQKISIYDPATGTVVQMNNIAPDSVLTSDKAEAENTKGQMLYAGDDFTFEFNSFDLVGSSGFTQLEAWMKADTDVRMVAAGVDDNILWYADSKLEVSKPYSPQVGGRNFCKVKITSKGGSKNVYVGKNIPFLLSGWQDIGGTAGLVDDYTNTGGSTPTWADPVQRMVKATGAALSFYLQSSIIFPIAGLKMQGSFNKVALTGGSGLSFKVDQLNFAGSSLQVSSSTMAVALTQFTTPPNIYKINFKIFDGTLTGALDMQCQYPYLGIDNLGGVHQDILK